MKNFTLKAKQLFAAIMMLACIPASAQFTATVEQYAKSDYTTVAAEFTLTEIATALETDTATLVAALDAWYNYDAESGAELPADMFFLKVGEELAADYTQGSPGGFWINRDGTVGSWGQGAVYYNSIWFDNENNADYFSIDLGQFPDSLAAGATLTPTFVLQHGEKQATFNITYIVKPLPTMPEPELAIAKLEIVGNAEVTVEQYPRNNYNSSAAYVKITGAAEALGVDEELLPDLLTNMLYKAYVDETYQIKVDSLRIATADGGWGREVLDAATGDTLPEVCAAPWDPTDQYYMDTWAYDAESDTLSCNIGQYPDNLEAGDVFYTNVYMVYGSKAYVVKYNVVIVENPDQGGDITTMTEVGKSVIRIEQQPTTDYSTSAIMLNTDSIAELLGCAAGDMTFQAIDNKGALSTNSTANNGGYWMTQGGVICTWGDNAYFFVEPAASNDYSQLNIGQMPGNTAIGEEGHTLMYLTSGSKYYTLDVTLAIVEGQKVDMNFESVATRSYTVQALDATYAWSDVENSAAIPFAQIYELIGTTEPVLYALNIDSIAEQTGEKYTKDYTMGEKPGFWVTEDGKKTAWGSAPWGITGLNSTADNFIIQCIQMDGFGVVGDVYNGQFFLVNEETSKMITINLTYQIVNELIEREVVGEDWIYLPVSMSDASVDYDLTKVATAFGFENVSDLFEGYYVKGLKADGTYTEGLDAIGSGVIFNTSGGADTYGDIGVGFSEDYTQIWTYSNVELDTPCKVEATMCFEIDSKQYILHLILLDPESYTGIENISAAKKDGKIYNLQGQEVAAPAKGIYIMNGKKVVVK